ncbi:YqaA family protein [Acinetobacter sp. WCHAc010052]|uniref:YqaA family protein n=1 Tax=Acinetobacter sp. WCHAc010052 TaxID=2004647 RepID=UPI000B3C40DB|nr:YqaA family protein [Acinetobacter sp. WCHAc010052]AXY59186.1 DedA family protein [Acinetobacter sp. WCHAc010052]
MAYLLLFLSAFGAATLLPLQSEAVLAGLLMEGKSSVVLLLLAASLGNIMGSCVNWWLGYKIEHYKNKKWFPVSENQLQRAQLTYAKYGYWSLLLSWLPVIGDPITLIAGLMRENFLRFLFIVSVAKTGRYLVIYLIFAGLV